MDSVAERLQRVREQIAQAALHCGRSPEQVRLVAVSKTKPASAIREAHAAGQRDFGENYVQELAAKAEELQDLEDLRWHLIGRLQRNKTKLALKLASVVHTADSLRLVQDLGKRAAEQPVPEPRRMFAKDDPRLPILVEVNVAGETQKAGCRPAELPGLLEAVEREPALRLVGLMTMPPHTEDPDAARPFFDELARLRERHGGPERLPELSMGMTHDLNPAVSAGATIVRIGTAIFGVRTPRRR
jgi:pyridoxal phosphate enzyme (YggS family)